MSDQLFRFRGRLAIEGTSEAGLAFFALIHRMTKVSLTDAVIEGVPEAAILAGQAVYAITSEQFEADAVSEYEAARIRAAQNRPIRQALHRIEELLSDVRYETDWSADGRYAIDLVPTMESTPPGLPALEECRRIVAELLMPESKGESS